MFLFIATIFIAELIIFSTLVFYIIKADKAVIELNKQVTEYKPQIQNALNGIKEAVIEISDKKDLLYEYLRKKRDQWIFKTIQTVLIYFLLFLFRGKCKKAAKICQGLLLAKDVWDSIPG